MAREQRAVPNATVTVSRSVAELPGGVRIVGPPKSEAGRRTVAIPAAILDELTFHLERYTAPGPTSLVFEGPKGGPLRRRNMNRSIWRPATQAVGIPHVHFHDLRHTGNTLAAATGASLRELMSRMGHSSAAAALRYQHATRERDAVIAAALSELVIKSRPRTLPENGLRSSQEGEGRDD